VDMAEEMHIRVNFGRPMPLFALGQVALMPHAVRPLHVFEPRYRQMVGDALDGSGQIAMAVVARGERARVVMGDSGLDVEGGEGLVEAGMEKPALRSAVCVGQIVQHHKLPDGQFAVALHGVCRARIVNEVEAPEGVLYRSAMLEPIGLAPVDEDALVGPRIELSRLLDSTVLRDMADAKAVVKCLVDPEMSTSAILELVTVSLLNDQEVRYQLLAEGDVGKRAALIRAELIDLLRLLKRAGGQRGGDAPKGCSWN